MIDNDPTIDHRTALAKKVFRFKTDAPDQESLIRFADSLLPGGLDSLDLGDALGAFLSLAESEEFSGNDSGEYLWVSPDGFTVIISQDWDLFTWGIELPPGVFDHITRQDIEDIFRDED